MAYSDIHHRLSVHVRRRQADLQAGIRISRRALSVSRHVGAPDRWDL